MPTLPYKVTSSGLGFEILKEVFGEFREDFSAEPAFKEHVSI